MWYKVLFENNIATQAIISNEPQNLETVMKWRYQEPGHVRFIEYAIVKAQSEIDAKNVASRYFNRHPS